MSAGTPAGRPAAHADLSPWLERPATSGVVTDYDGTLAPIVADPTQARPLPGAHEVLSRLSHQLALVAVISGRPVSFLAGQLGGIRDLLLVGLYGLERQRGGETSFAEGAGQWRETISAAADAAQAQVPPGVEIERKGLSFVLHSRRHPSTFAWVKAWAAEQAVATGLVVQPGRMSLELLPPLGTDKGNTIEELAEGLEAVCFVGDDVGDLPAFAALARLRSAGKTTLAVGVSSPEQPEELVGATDLVVPGPAGVLQLLQDLSREAPPPSR